MFILISESNEVKAFYTLSEMAKYLCTKLSTVKRHFNKKRKFRFKKQYWYILLKEEYITLKESVL